MNKKIPSRLAILIIIFFALIVSTYSWTKGSDLNYTNNGNYLEMLKKQKKATCQTHIYQGKVGIKTWQSSENGEAVLNVVQEDISKMPSDDAKSFKLIDATSELEKKLAKSSESNPIEIEISGFAALCEGFSLASLNYRDGIFNPYIAK